MVDVYAWLRHVRAAIIMDDLEPEYSTLDVMDGLGRRDRLPGPSLGANQAKSSEGRDQQP